MNIGLLGRNSTHFLAYGQVFTELGNHCFYTDEKNCIEKDLNNYKNFKRTKLIRFSRKLSVNINN